MNALLLILAMQDPVSGTIDREIEAKWKAAGARPAAAADDYTFFRRLHLDVAGRLPRPDEIRAFVADKSADRRAKAVDRLLESEEAARYWADKWLRLLFLADFREADPFVIDFQSVYKWMEKAYAENLPYDRFVAEFVAAEGDKYENPAVNFLIKHAKPNEAPVEVTSRVTRLFLGIQIQCAQCHDHPYDRWTQEDYWGMAAFFGGLRSRTRQTFDGIKTKLMQSEPVQVRVVTIMEEDQTASPKFLDGRSPAAKEKARAALMKYMKTMEGRQFAKAFVNREWAHFMGRGFVEPFDKFSDKNRASHPELLEALAKDFEENGYDVRRLRRGILNSRAYALSSKPVKDAAPELFAFKPLKPQGPVEFLNNFTYALSLDTFFQQFYEQFKNVKELPESYRNIIVFRIYLMSFVSGVLAPGGKLPEETKYLGTTRLALKLMNNHDLQNVIKAYWGHLKSTLEKFEKPEDRLEEIFLTLLSRAPDAAEKKRYLGYIERKRGHASAYEDVYWVLLNSPEYFFNH